MSRPGRLPSDIGNPGPEPAARLEQLRATSLERCSGAHLRRDLRRPDMTYAFLHSLGVRGM